MFTVRLKLTCWGVRKRVDEPLAVDRIRRELVGVELYAYLMPLYRLTTKVDHRTQLDLWRTIDEALELTGRVMR